MSEPEGSSAGGCVQCGGAMPKVSPMRTAVPKMEVTPGAGSYEKNSRSSLDDRHAAEVSGETSSEMEGTTATDRDSKEKTR